MAELNPVQELVGFVLERIGENREVLPTSRKIRLLRAAALCVVSEQESAALFGLATALEEAELRQNELFVIFLRKQQGETNGEQLPTDGPQGPSRKEDV